MVRFDIEPLDADMPDDDVAVALFDIPVSFVECVPVLPVCGPPGTPGDAPCAFGGELGGMVGDWAEAIPAMPSARAMVAIDF